MQLYIPKHQLKKRERLQVFVHDVFDLYCTRIREQQRSASVSSFTSQRRGIFMIFEGLKTDKNAEKCKLLDTHLFCLRHGWKPALKSISRSRVVLEGVRVGRKVVAFRSRKKHYYSLVLQTVKIAKSLQPSQKSG